MMTVGGCLAKPDACASRPPRMRDELLVDDLDDLLGGVERLADLGAEGALAHRAGELLDDGQRDVGVEQGEPDVADRRVDVGLREPALAAQVLEGRGQAVGQGCKHRARLSAPARGSDPDVRGGMP